MSRTETLLIAIAMIGLLSTGCRQQMAEAPAYDPLEYSDFFADGQASRKPVEGTVPRGHLRLDDHLYTGKLDGQLVTTYPFEVTREVLDRGEERYNIFCTPCHGRTGDGNGIIVQRGHRQPPSFHEQRMVEQPVGHWIDVITNGFGAMPSYVDQIQPHDRWAIVAYIQALQMTRGVTIDELSPRMRNEFDEGLMSQSQALLAEEENGYE